MQNPQRMSRARNIYPTAADQDIDYRPRKKNLQEIGPSCEDSTSFSGTYGPYAAVSYYNLFYPAIRN